MEPLRKRLWRRIGFKQTETRYWAASPVCERFRLAARNARARLRTTRDFCGLDCDSPSDQNDAIVGQPEEIADMHGVSLHRYIQNFQQSGQPSFLLAGDDRAVANVVDRIIEIQ